MVVIVVGVPPALELLLARKFYKPRRLVSSSCLKYFHITLDVGNSVRRCKTSFVL